MSRNPTRGPRPVWLHGPVTRQEAEGTSLWRGLKSKQGQAHTRQSRGRKL